MNKNHGVITFKQYNIDQMQLPMSLEDLIEETHLVRVVSNAVERMNLQILLDQYKGGGTSSYHPEMMLKVLVYAYTQKTYSSRRIAKALRENIHFMWISGNNKPDFRTINRFRSSVMKGIIDQVFASVLELLIEDGHVSLENYFLDGTKIEANANKYSFVWAKSVNKNKVKLQDRIGELLKEIEEVSEEENARYGDSDLEERGVAPIDTDKLDKKIQELNEKLAKQRQERLAQEKKEFPEDKKLKKTLKKLEDDFQPRLFNYERQEKKFKGRNSYSKTDEDATFMRMKEDHMRNGQLKPGYNIQIGTENQFIVNYTIHNNRSDTGCLIPHLEQVSSLLGRKPKQVIADSGYGSQENYEYLEGQGIKAYVKYNYFHKEQKKSFKQKIFRVENLVYDEKTDEYICPAEKRLTFKTTFKRKTDLGYVTERRLYECEDCSGCSFREECCRGQRNRRAEINLRLNQLKSEAAERLTSDQGAKLRSQRAIEVESVFGRIKHNWAFRRFLLRGMEKVKVEWGLLSIAHNLTKIATV